MTILHTATNKSFAYVFTWVINNFGDADKYRITELKKNI